MLQLPPAWRPRLLLPAPTLVQLDEYCQKFEIFVGIVRGVVGGVVGPLDSGVEAARQVPQSRDGRLPGVQAEEAGQLGQQTVRQAVQHRLVGQVVAVD